MNLRGQPSGISREPSLTFQSEQEVTSVSIESQY